MFEFDSSLITEELAAIFNSLSKKCRIPPSDNYHFEYDQIVSLGEALSTKIVHAYLVQIGIKSAWLDAREIIHTILTPIGSTFFVCILFFCTFANIKKQLEVIVCLCPAYINE